MPTTTLPNSPARGAGLRTQAGELLRAAHADIAQEMGTPTLFTLEGRAVTEEMLGAPDGLLPVFAWRAQALFAYGVGRGMGLTFASGGQFGGTVDMSACRTPTSEVLLFCLEAFEDARVNLLAATQYPGATQIDALVTEFKQAMAALEATPDLTLRS